MSKAYRITFIALISICCRAQTVTPLIIESDQAIRCQNNRIRFKVQNDDLLNAFNWTITPSRSATVYGSNRHRILEAVFESPSTYTISVEAVDSVLRSGSFVIKVSRTATAAFNASLSSNGYPNELLLTNYSSGFNAISWNYSDGSTDNLDIARKPYYAGGSYSLSLVAYGENGCNDTASYSFTIADSSSISLPNVFTPNNDGVNELYKPITRGISHLSARIFNRQQTLVHSWDRVNGSWDGHTTSGEACPEDVYIIVVEARGFDDKTYNLKGTITLLR